MEEAAVPFCPFFWQCGGCDLQHLAYRSQCQRKSDRLVELFAPLRPAAEAWQPYVPCPGDPPQYFRNKIRYGLVATDYGYAPSRHSKGSAGADIAVDACFLQSPQSMQAILWTAACATANQWSLYDAGTKGGWFKHLLVRESKATGEYLFGLVTLPGQASGLAEWAEELRRRVPGTVGIVHCQLPNTEAMRSDDTVLFGRDYLYDTIGIMRCRVSLHAFFQTNGSLVANLYEAAVRAIPESTSNLWDLYAGSATIAAAAHGRARQVLAVEQHPDNIRDARENLAMNGIGSVTPVEASVEAFLESGVPASGKPDAIIVDPPRAGLGERVRGTLPFLGARTIVYVSCNPATCVRDLFGLTRSGYAVRSLQGFDMFPHTEHSEVVAVLEKPNKNR